MDYPFCGTRVPGLPLGPFGPLGPIDPRYPIARGYFWRY